MEEAVKGTGVAHYFWKNSPQGKTYGGEQYPLHRKLSRFREFSSGSAMPFMYVSQAATSSLVQPL